MLGYKVMKEKDLQNMQAENEQLESVVEMQQQTLQVVAKQNQMYKSGGALVSVILGTILVGIAYKKVHTWYKVKFPKVRKALAE